MTGMMYNLGTNDTFSGKEDINLSIISSVTLESIEIFFTNRVTEAQRREFITKRQLRGNMNYFNPDGIHIIECFKIIAQFKDMVAFTV
ncbi:hypothetical protein CEXT_600761 [Caerostris extrusa]|uniref:LAGLIDADG homing endonuclease n=1 Tax=Caerostris extrusa TaxID=172846 RepID=A0AAV4RAB4_CAEEX|nr:hypothetical protein CEXT_600761 [Caerostris extrusa]